LRRRAVGPGRIVAAEFTNRGETTRAYLWREGAGDEAYYTERGMPVRKAFLRSPMEFSRVTSGFANERFHPILNNWRAHKGVDFAAPHGTPSRRPAPARSEFAGTQAGYGNVVVLHHRGSFTTVYAICRNSRRR